MPRNSFFPNPDNKPAGFSPATRVGNMVFSSGQVAADSNGNVVGEGDAGAQAEQVFNNIEAALIAAGAVMSDVTKSRRFWLIARIIQPTPMLARKPSMRPGRPAALFS